MTVTIHNATKMNPLEMILVAEDMERKYPDLQYTMTAGNDCIWVYWGSTVPMNLYYIFKEGRIVDIQVD